MYIISKLGNVDSPYISRIKWSSGELSVSYVSMKSSAHQYRNAEDAEVVCAELNGVWKARTHTDTIGFVVEAV